jgi:hypothetical protein
MISACNQEVSKYMSLAQQNRSPEARSCVQSNIAISSFKHVICSPRTPSRTILVVAELSPRNERQSGLSCFIWAQDYSPQCLSVLTEHLWFVRVLAPPWRARQLNAGVRLAGFRYVCTTGSAGRRARLCGWDHVFRCRMREHFYYKLGSWSRGKCSLS